jgi:hypothetical protein
LEDFLGNHISSIWLGLQIAHKWPELSGLFLQYLEQAHPVNLPPRYFFVAFLLMLFYWLRKRDVPITAIYDCALFAA